MDMLCIAAENDGYVAVRGKPLSATEIARATGGTESEVVALLDELERNGVFSRDKRKCIYSRRMIRDEKKGRIARENGKKGGAVSLEKQKGIFASGGQKTEPQSPESRIHKPEKEEKEPTLALSGGESALDDWPADYRVQFWQTYPRKTEKLAALSKLDAIRKSRKVPWVVFFAGVKRHAAHVVGTEERYIKHPTTWLNRGCWEDEPSQNNGGEHATDRTGGGRGGASGRGFGSHALARARSIGGAGS
jgi:hypothetical protein